MAKKICIYGAGAIGGHLAARLIATGGHDVSIIARGAHLAAIRDNGIFLRAGDDVIGGRPHLATDDPTALPEQDIVLVTLKAPSLPEIAKPLARLLGARGIATFLMNGIPWWWNFGAGCDEPLPLLDPEGALWREVGGHRALGGVVNSSNQVIAPGVILNTGGNRWMIGEPDGSPSARANAVVDLLSRTGLNAKVSKDIRGDIWRKIFVNISSNPFAALTRLPSRDAAEVHGLDEIAIKAIDEAMTVAAAMGRDLRSEIDPEKIVRPAGGRSAGRSSMLQDVDAGRALEVDGIVGQVREFGRVRGVPTPVLDVVLPLLRGLDRSLRMTRDNANGASSGALP